MTTPGPRLSAPGRGWCLAVAVAATLAPGLASGQAQGLEERLARVERLVNSGTLLDLLDRVEGLQREVRELRGQVEQQRHLIDQAKGRQRELYLDLDRRLQRLEAGGQPPASGAPAPAATPGAAGTTPAAEPSGGDPLAEQAAYQRAFDLLKEGRYPQAAEAFTAFLKAYPDSGYADNAQYWLGEARYVTRDFKASLREFQRLVARYPDSGKLTHALLKIGYSHHELGNLAEARKVLADLVREHPGTTAARLAQDRLERIKGQGG